MPCLIKSTFERPVSRFCSNSKKAACLAYEERQEKQYIVWAINFCLWLRIAAITLLFGSLFAILIQFISFDKTVYPSFCVNNFLRTRIERMAIAANFNPDLIFCRTKHDLVSTNAGSSYIKILWMDSFFHIYNQIMTNL